MSNLDTLVTDLTYAHARAILAVRKYVTDGLAILPAHGGDSTLNAEIDTARAILLEMQALPGVAAPRNFAESQITGEGFRAVGIYRLFFRQALRDVRKRHADYEAEVSDWYENGHGRSRRDGGLGYRFPYCIHGASLTTDYDNICFGCEESETVIEEARGLARERFVRFNDRWDWVSSAPGDLPGDARKQAYDWATSLFPGAK